MVENQLAATGSGDTFNSFAELQQAHITTMAFDWGQKLAVNDGDARTRIRELVQKMRNTGARIEDAAERQVAQNIVDYWSAQTISIDDLGEGDWSPAKLLPFDPSVVPGRPTTQGPDEISRLLGAQKKIQMGAMARLWKGSGRDDGYLLDGAALQEAESLSKDDRDIADFVDASLMASRSRLKRKLRVRAIITVIMTALAIAAVGASILAVRGWQNSQRNEEFALKAITGALKVVLYEVDTGTISTEAASRVLATPEIEEFMTVPKGIVQDSGAPAAPAGLLTRLLTLLQTPLTAVIERPAILAATRIQLLTAASDVRELMGNDDEARGFAKQAQAMAQRFLEKDPGNPERKRLLYEGTFRYGDLLNAANKDDEALNEYDRALPLATELTKSLDEGKWLQRVAFIENKRGDIFLVKRDWEKSKAAYDNALTIGQSLVRNGPDNADAQKTLGDATARLGGYFQARKRLDEALSQYTEALRIRDLLANRFPGNIIYQSNLAKAYEFMGNVHKDDKRFEQALPYYENALKIKRRLAESDPDNTTWQAALANQNVEIGDLLRAKQDTAAAMTNYRSALTIREHLVLTDKANVNWQRNLANIHDRLAGIFGDERQFDAALKEYSVSLEIRKELAGRFRDNSDRQRELGQAYEHIGDTLESIESSESLQQAFNAYQQGLAVVQAFPNLGPLRERLQQKIEDLAPKIK